MNHTKRQPLPLKMLSETEGFSMKAWEPGSGCCTQARESGTQAARGHAPVPVPVVAQPVSPPVGLQQEYLVNVCANRLKAIHLEPQGKEMLEMHLKFKFLSFALSPAQMEF